MASDFEIDKSLTALETVYPHHFSKMNDEMAKLARRIFHQILRDVDGALLEAATLQWLSTARPFHPSPGELRDLALTLTEHYTVSADEAWIEVMDAIRRIGSYGVPQWSNDTIARTVRAFGWKELCATENDQMSYARDSFMKIYRAQMTRQHDAALMLPEVQNVIGRLAEMKRKEIEAHQ